MSFQALTVICSLSLTLFVSLHCTKYLQEVEDFKKLDEKIASFLKDPSKEGWESNLKEIEFFDSSLKDMIKTLNATFDGLTKEYFRKAERFVNSGKPVFIDTDVVELEVQPRIGVTDDQLQRLYWLRLHSEKDWEMLIDMVTVKKQIEIMLP
uniref:Prolyl 4-hydroxylase alpha-subunit N-terminal domain-containing protein n=1 Tax=Cuerna arida TaxID=1464854 RepID=A0A1B6ETU6_9HEMI